MTGVQTCALPIYDPNARALIYECWDKETATACWVSKSLGEKIEEEIRSEEKDYVDNFDDPDHGATLEIRFKAENIGQKNPWIKASKVNFVEREEDARLVRVAGHEADQGKPDREEPSLGGESHDQHSQYADELLRAQRHGS